jgi:hypothetical protein
MNLQPMIRTTNATQYLALAAGLCLAAVLVTGCSSGVTPSYTSDINSPAVAVPVLITDAPSDQLVAFTLTLNSITLTDTAGKTASILGTPTTIEICHLNGIQAPLLTANIPQDTYASATITFSNPQITYINSAGLPISVTPTLATSSYTITFPAPITVSNTSTSLLVDLLAGQSVSINGTTVTVTPVFSVKSVPPTSAVPPQGQNGTGMQQMGTVVSVSGTTLVIEPGSGPNFTLTTNSSTVLQGFTALSALTAGELVQVDFVVQSGGCTQQPGSNAVLCTPVLLLATRIQLAPPPPGGQKPNLLNGPVTSVTPGTSFKMVLMQGLGPAVSPVAASAVSVFTITTNSSTVFAITPQFVSLAGLPFTPSFSATNITAGQTVGVTASSVSGTTAVATNVYLIPQTVGGTVSAVATSGNYTAYTLTLASGSAFASLSGASTVTVYTSTATAPPTAAANNTPIKAGSQVRFNGLVFNTGSGSFSMVAGCSPDGPPGI